MSEILLTGGSGRLGTELRKLRSYSAPTREELDITNPSNVAGYLSEHNPRLIVHSAGYVDSLKPEKDPEEKEKCYQANVIAVDTLIKYARCPIIYISTEGVIEPYNTYTLTKLLAEYALKRFAGHTIIRTNFWPRPFQFPKACDDLYTIGDYIDVIAKQIDELVDAPCSDEIVYVGTGVKTVYDIAKQTVPGIEPVSCKLFGIPRRSGLLDVYKEELV